MKTSMGEAMSPATEGRKSNTVVAGRGGAGAFLGSVMVECSRVLWAVSHTSRDSAIEWLYSRIVHSAWRRPLGEGARNDGSHQRSHPAQSRRGGSPSAGQVGMDSG